jgi:hypothetical protein
MATAKTKKVRKVYATTDSGKAEKFRDFANLRTRRALSALNAVSKLANPRAYRYTPEQVGKIRSALELQLARTVKAFENPTAANDSGFSL